MSIGRLARGALLALSVGGGAGQARAQDGAQEASAAADMYAGYPVGRVELLARGSDGKLAPVGAGGVPGSSGGGGGLPGATQGSPALGANAAAAAFDALTGGGLPTTTQMGTVATNTANAASALGSATAGLPAVAANTAPRSGAWTDASLTASGAATTPTTGFLAAQSARIGLHLTNTGSALACFNYTSPATLNAGGTACGLGSQPLGANGGQYFEDLPGNVSNEAISFICTGTACPITVKGK